MKKINLLEKALAQTEPEKTIEKMIQNPGLYNRVCEKLHEFLSELEPGQFGTHEIVIDDHNFYIDYEMHDDLTFSLSEAELYKDGKSVKVYWLDWSFEQAIPVVNFPDKEWPGIENYGEFL